MDTYTMRYSAPDILQNIFKKYVMLGDFFSKIYSRILEDVCVLLYRFPYLKTIFIFMKFCSVSY